MKLQAGKQVRRCRHDYHIHLDEFGLFRTIATVKHAFTAGVVYLIGKHAYRQAEKLKLELEQYPPHTIFCECRTCLPPIRKHFFKKGK